LTLTGLCSLAVDYGRYQMCKTQLQRAADCGARAGALNLVSSASAAISAATAVTDANYVDAYNISSNSNVTVSVQLLDWVSSSNYTVLSSGNYTLANAVRVTVTYTVPLNFGAVLGYSSKVATRSSTAMLTTNSATVSVTGNSNPWLAGEPKGTQASQPDPNWDGQDVVWDHPWEYDIAGPIGGSNAEGEPYESPPEVGIPITPGAVITLTNASGLGSWDRATPPFSSPAGDTGDIEDDAASKGVGEHGISDVTMPLGGIVGVFLGSSLPDNTTAPTPLNFTTQAERDYATLDPKLQQTFYAGAGQSSAGAQQSIVVPQGATRMYLGMMDGWEWSNNIGGYTVTVTTTQVQMVQ
jgi:Flp pilus assembly protein TadG